MSNGKGGRRISSQNSPLKNTQGSKPYQNQPFRGPHHKKETPTGNVPMGDNPSQAITNCFLRQGILEQQRQKGHFIALIHPIQWTIANPVGADQPAKCQKKTSCVSTGWPVSVLCIRKVAHRTSFLSRQSDIIASFSFGACTVQTCFQPSPDFSK